MKTNIKLLSIATIVFSFTACSSTGKNKNLKHELAIVHVNDVHGRAETSKAEMGYAGVAALINEEREKYGAENVLFLDAGDTFHGTTFATLDKGESIAKTLDKLGLEAMVAGNHDFNYGYKRLIELDKATNFKVLTANVIDKDGKYLGTPYIIKNIQGKKVGIFGLSTPETYYKTNPNNVEGIKFLPPIEIAKQTVATLKNQGVDFIVLLSHLGDDEATERKYQSIGVAEAVDGINLIIDGHSHTRITEKKVVNNTVIVQTGEYTKDAGVIEVDFDELANGPTAIDYRLISRNEFTPTDVTKLDVNKNYKVTDEEVDNFIKGIKENQKKITDVIIGTTNVKLEGDRAFVRTGETNLSNVLTDAMIAATGADVALTNGGGIRTSIDEGSITVGDIISVLPFGNYVITKEITGADLKAALEHGLSKYPDSNGGFPQFGGIKVEMDPKKPAGQRITKITFNNKKKFDLKAKYIIATNDFMAVGGDDYTSLKNGKQVAHYPALDEILIEYIRNGAKLPAKADGRLKIK
jgi:2',3'-cyclic-nucleotide 2'-phosphodiesterase (5'-nucleotidase family)